MTYQTNAKRLLDNLHTLRTFTDTPDDGVTRFSYGAQDARAREYIIKRAENCGCRVSIDALQNIRIGLPTNQPGRKTVLSGSHIDTVRNGGWLDGIYGVCGALEVLETLAEHPEAVKDANFNYELVIFAEEEGSGFGSTMTGSKFITGIYGESDLDKLTNDDGQTLRQVLQSLSPCGPDGKTIVYNTEVLSAEALQRTRWDFDQVQTMLELHIEQGPVLDREGLSLGIVDSIFGMRVIEVTLTGVGNHAGATPMTERYDALCTAAECILAAEAHVKADDDKRTVVTCGKMELAPNCSNVIPETVKFSLEVRDKDETKIDHFMNEIIDLIIAIAEKRQVSCEIKEHSKSSPLHLTDRLIHEMADHAADLKLAYKVMDSGAVHDACMIAHYAQTGMIFVPSINGRSHVPEENTKETDLAAGVQFLLDTVLQELHEGGAHQLV